MDNYVFNQVIVALYRGDTEILQTLLSSNTFRTTRAAAPPNSRILNDWDILNYCYDSEQSKIRRDVFKTLVSSPKIDVNVTRNNFSCLNGFVSKLKSYMTRIQFHDEFLTDYMTSRICALLDAGADPRLDECGFGIISAYGSVQNTRDIYVDIAKKRELKGLGGLLHFEQLHLEVWNTILKKMEAQQDNRE